MPAHLVHAHSSHFGDEDFPISRFCVISAKSKFHRRPLGTASNLEPPMIIRAIPSIAVPSARPLYDAMQYAGCRISKSLLCFDISPTADLSNRMLGTTATYRGTSANACIRCHAGSTSQYPLAPVRLSSYSSVAGGGRTHRDVCVGASPISCFALILSFLPCVEPSLMCFAPTQQRRTHVSLLLLNLMRHSLLVLLHRCTVPG